MSDYLVEKYKKEVKQNFLYYMRKGQYEILKMHYALFLKFKRTDFLK